MAFLDNSGDIILDAVLTDTGRLRLAKGDGSFNITKFALGDDEINYALYDKNHASGSAYYDIEILQTPVLEAFTNNTSLLKSKLLSISRTNLLYLPIIKNNTKSGLGKASVDSGGSILAVAVDQTTVNNAKGDDELPDGIIDGPNVIGASSKSIVFDQGIESNALGSGEDVALDADLVETQYIIEIDNRFGFLADPDGAMATPSFIDDDNIASYFLSTTTNQLYFKSLGQTNASMQDNVLLGPVGNRLSFLIGPSTNLASSTYLFTQLGSTTQINNGEGSPITVKSIDTTVRITGATTGFRVDLPVRFIKS
tara:strand:+ start:572 stop:1504 length:933 start_codon:yes stop_codon:yes gene_type:complete